MSHYHVIVIGGGAAGFFTAIQCAEARPDLSVAIFERGQKVLDKVWVSGGGRCNVTHACFYPRELVRHYPRGSKALLGPFHRFACGDTVEWFESRGVPLKTEADGRMFPVSNQSRSIMDCLTGAAQNAGVEVRTGHGVSGIVPRESGFVLKTRQGEFTADKVMVAPGSSPAVWKMLAGLGHTIVPPVPSLFTFNIKDARIEGLAGLSVAHAEVAVAESKIASSGPLLITHWGMSGPAILRASAFGARVLAERDYRFTLIVNWTDQSPAQVRAMLVQRRNDSGKKQVQTLGFPGIPARLWKRLCAAAGIDERRKIGDLPNALLDRLADEVTAGEFPVEGKSTFKEEFVTAGGVALDEVNFKTFESKLLPGMYFAGEILDIDAVTGGFNFQAAWTGGFIAGQAIAHAS